MTNWKDTKKNEKFESKFPVRLSWNLLSEDEKKEIIEKAKLKKAEDERLANKKKADILTGRQKTLENAWG